MLASVLERSRGETWEKSGSAPGRWVQLRAEVAYGGGLTQGIMLSEMSQSEEDKYHKISTGDGEDCSEVPFRHSVVFL